MLLTMFKWHSFLSLIFIIVFQTILCRLVSFLVLHLNLCPNKNRQLKKPKEQMICLCLNIYEVYAYMCIYIHTHTHTSGYIKVGAWKKKGSQYFWLQEFETPGHGLLLVHSLLGTGVHNRSEWQARERSVIFVYSCSPLLSLHLSSTSYH